MSKQTGKLARADAVVMIDTSNRWFNAIMIGLCLLVLLAVRLQQNQNTTGDEPYYLLMSHSLVHDRDLALANNYQHKDYLGFYNNPILNQGSNKYIDSKYNKLGYSVHGIGLPLLLAPSYAVASKTGVVFEMVALATFVVCLTWVWSKQVTGNRKVAYLTAGLLTICYFFNYLVGAIYPDMLMAAITLIALIMTDRYYKTQLHQFLIGLALGFLIIVHFKAVTLVGPMLLIMCYRVWKLERKLPWLAIAAVATCMAYYFVTLHQWFGMWNLSTIEGGQSFGANPFHDASAMLFDSNRGLLVYNPVLVLIFVGLPLWFKKHRTSFAITLVALAPSIAALCMIPNWNGSAAPTGRYLMEFLPAFMPAIAVALLELRKVWQQVMITALAALTFLISLDVTLMRFPYIDGGLFQTRSPLFAQIEHHIGIPFDRLLPKYSNETTLIGGHPVTKLLAAYAIVSMLFAYGCYLAKTVRVKKPR